MLTLQVLMSSPVYAEDSFDEESYRDYSEGSDQELFSSSDGKNADDSPDFIPESPKKPPVNCISAVRRLFAKPLRSYAISSVPSQPTVTGTRELSESGGDDGVSTQNLILQEIRKANSRLDSFANQLDSLESRLASVETNHLSVTPSSSSASGVEKSAERGKRKVPAKVSVSFMWAISRSIQFYVAHHSCAIYRLYTVCALFHSTVSEMCIKHLQMMMKISLAMTQSE